MQVASAPPPSTTLNAGLTFDPAPQPTGAVKAFLDYQKETPAQKLRDEILGTMGLTEEKLKHMEPKERTKLEAKIREIMKQKVEEQAEKKTGQIIDLKA